MQCSTMILVVRSVGRLAETVRAVRAACGGEVMGFGVSEMRVRAVGRVDGVVVFTSVYGVAAVAEVPLGCVCVGEVTAAAARAKGFEVVYVGDGDGEVMARGMVGVFGVPTRFVHVHGDVAGLGWHEVLRAAGHTVEAVCGYDTVYADAVPVEVVEVWPRLTHVCLFSAGGAEHLHRLVLAGNMASCPHPSARAVVISPQVAAVAMRLFPHVMTAPMPTLDSLLGVLRADVLGH